MAASASFPISRLRSPDDGSPLREVGSHLEDHSGNQYPIVDGVPQLLPKHPVQGTLAYRLTDHLFFREFRFQRRLQPIFPCEEHTPGLKQAIIAGFIPPPSPGASCLDHGCGAGRLRPFLEGRGYTYVGVDNESGVSTQQGGGKRFAGGATHVCDLHRLPFADNTFQFAVSYSVFEHLQHPFVGAAELARVMIPGGICVVAVAAAIPFHMDSFYHHTHFGVLATFHNAGFEVKQVAGANWNAYVAMSAMDGLPGPRWIRSLLVAPVYWSHRVLWYARARLKRRDQATENLRRHLMMAGIVKAVLVKPVQPHR